MDSDPREPAAVIFEASGGPLDAHFRVEAADSRFFIVFASSGGARDNPNARNRDYAEGIELVLGRLAQMRAVVTDVLVDSRPARRLPEADRRVHVGCPIHLDGTTDLAFLRLAITRGQRTIARAANVRSETGNNRKRIRLTVELAEGDLNSASLQERLSRGSVYPSPAPFGPYRRPDKNPSRQADPWSHDPSALDRSRFAHIETQEALSSSVQQAGLEPRSPTGEPDFDLAWVLDSDVLYVAEVKSLTNTNETQQLRLGLGQVLHYKLQLERQLPGYRIQPVLALERPPTDEIWWTIAKSVGMILTYPPDWPRLALGGSTP